MYDPSRSSYTSLWVRIGRPSLYCEGHHGYELCFLNLGDKLACGFTVSDLHNDRGSVGTVFVINPNFILHSSLPTGYLDSRVVKQTNQLYDHWYRDNRAQISGYYHKSLSKVSLKFSTTAVAQIMSL